MRVNPDRSVPALQRVILRHFAGRPLAARLAIGSSWLLGGGLVTAGIAALQSLLLARTLGPKNYGVLALVMIYPTLVNQLLDSRAWEALVKFGTQFSEEDEPGKVAATVKVCLILDAATAVAAYLLIAATASAAASAIVKVPSAAGLIRLYGLIILASIPAGTAAGLLRMTSRFSWIARLDVLVSVTQLTGVVLIVYAGGGLVQIIRLMVAIAFAKLVLLVILGVRASVALSVPRNWRSGSLRLLKHDAGIMARFLVSTNFLAVLKSFQRNGDSLFLGFWLGPSQVGCYRVGRSMAEMLNFPVVPLFQTIHPELVKLWHQQAREAMRGAVAKLVKMTSMGAAVAVASVWLAGDPLVRWTAGPSYVSAVPVLKIIVVGMGISISFQFCHSALMAAGLAGSAMRAYAGGVLAQIVLVLTLVPAMGLTGAAVSFAAFNIVWSYLLFTSYRSLFINRAAAAYV